jgi:hypothetical protein
MGAFFLYKESDEIDLSAVHMLFYKNGFKSPTIFHLDRYTLLLYRKQMISDDNFYFLGKTAVFSVGTPIYKGLSYKNTLHSLLSDFINNCLNLDELIGNYCIIFYHHRKLYFLIDPTNMTHVFIDTGKSRISSSFLATLLSFRKKLNANKPAIYEKILTGFNIAPDTLVSEILQITPDIAQKLDMAEIAFIKNRRIPHAIEYHTQGFSRSVEHQIDVLTKFFVNISALCNEYRAQVGLSGGYDSRLIYALCEKAALNVGAYSHNTVGVHEKEQKIAKMMISKRSTEFHSYPTKSLETYNDEAFECLLKDCLYFSDGRSGFDMSTFSPIYTRNYRINIMGEAGVNINGSGGEIFRNYSHSGRKLSLKEWMKAHVYYPNINKSINIHLFETIHEEITKKIALRLDCNHTAEVDYYYITRYFAEIKMPDSKSIYGNAQNQLAFYITPFMDRMVVQSAYQAIPYMGTSGNYEAEIIRRIAPDLASILSNYGYPLDCEPLFVRLRHFIKCHIPDRINNQRYMFQRNFCNFGLRNFQSYEGYKKSSSYMSKIDELLRSLFPEVNWSELMRNHMAILMLSSLGSFLLEFEHKIKFQS